MAQILRMSRSIGINLSLKYIPWGTAYNQPWGTASMGIIYNSTFTMINLNDDTSI